MPEPIGTTVLIDTFDRIVDSRIAQASIRNRMQQGISRFIDKNSDILYTLNMSDRYSFSDRDRAVIYDACGLTERMITDAIRQSEINKTNKIQTNPFYHACMLVARGLLKINDKNTAHLVVTYMSMMMYVSAHRGRWQTKPNKAVMEYTLAHLDRGFKITQMSSIAEFIKDNADTTFDTYETWIYNPPSAPPPIVERKVGASKKMVEVIPGADLEMANIIYQFWSRLKRKLILIAQVFYKNKEAGLYLNYDSSVHNEKELRLIDNDSFAMDRIANTVYTKLINHQFKQQWLKMSITQSAVSYPKLSNLFDDIIQEDDDEKLRLFILAILEYFVTISGNPIDKISTPKFIQVINAGYGSAATSEQMQLIKDTLEFWVNTYMVRYGRANYGRTASIAYKKSLLMTIVYIINYEAKLMG